MKKIKLYSPEFERVLKNLQLENLSLSPELKEKVIEIVNSGIQISPDTIKEALDHGKIQ
nr:Zn-dependent hydrolase [Lysinibacillus timonensis]